METSQPKEEKGSAQEVGSASGARDWAGGGLGILTFLLGLGVLFFTFRLAAEMFAVPAADALGTNKDVTELGKSFGHVVLRIGMLLVMSVVGSMITGHGIKLYLASRSQPKA